MSPTGHATASAAPVVPTDAAPHAYAGIDQFAIGFDARDRARLHELWDEIIDSQQWSHSQFNDRWEQAWATWNGCGAVAMGSFSGGAMAALAYAGVGPGDTVLCPSNTFMATPLTAIRAGAEVQFVDSRRDDLCMDFDDFERKVAQHKPKAAWLVHIGGHIAFDVAADRRAVRGRGDLPDRGLRPRPRRRLGRPQAGHVGQRRRLLVLRDEDGVDRRGRNARLARRGAARIRTRVSQLRQAVV